MKTTTTETPKVIVTDGILKMIKASWLTGDDERDAKRLSRKFHMIGFRRPQWRQIVKLAKEFQENGLTSSAPPAS